MAATRRELLAGLGAGLVAMQGTALARGEGVRVGERLASMGDIEDLRREIRDTNQRMQNALARLRRTGFGPSPLVWTGTASSGGVIFGSSRYNMPFPGSVVAMSAAFSGLPSGTPGVDFWTFTVRNDITSTNAALVLDGDETTSEAVFDKGETTFAPGDELTMLVDMDGSPTSGEVTLIVWVSFT